MSAPRRLGLAVLGLVVAGCANDGPTAGGPGFGLLGGAAGTSEVTIVGQDILFDVTELEFSVGEEVIFTFENRDDVVRHSLHVEGPGLDEATPILPGPVVQELVVRFDEPGEYEFFCDTHPTEMRGVITVS